MNEKSTIVILEDSPEAASIQTVTGWVSRLGRYWGDDERAARYDGATHRRCECGAMIKRNSYCETCSENKEIDRWNGMPFVAWNGTDCLYSQAADRYFRDLDELTDYLNDESEEGKTVEGLRLIICTPNYLSEIDLCEANEEIIPEDGDDGCLPDAVHAAMEALNSAIRESRTPAQAISWSPGKTRPTPESVSVE